MPGNAPPHTGERELPLAYLAQQRDGLHHAAFGLTDEQARLTPTAGTLSIGGLLKHEAATERGWIDIALQREPAASREDQESDDHDRFGLREDETLADIVRESVDGATMYELMAGAEGWPETEWLKPWRPSES